MELVGGGVIGKSVQESGRRRCERTPAVGFGLWPSADLALEDGSSLRDDHRRGEADELRDIRGVVVVDPDIAGSVEHHALGAAQRSSVASGGRLEGAAGGEGSDPVADARGVAHNPDGIGAVDLHILGADRAAVPIVCVGGGELGARGIELVDVAVVAADPYVVIRVNGQAGEGIRLAGVELVTGLDRGAGQRWGGAGGELADLRAARDVDVAESVSGGADGVGVGAADLVEGAASADNLDAVIGVGVREPEVIMEIEGEGFRAGAIRGRGGSDGRERR